MVNYDFKPARTLLIDVAFGSHCCLSLCLHLLVKGRRFASLLAHNGTGSSSRSLFGNFVRHVRVVICKRERDKREEPRNPSLSDISAHHPR
jgi:mevalonate pyrophosphate decarboxylase